MAKAASWRGASVRALLALAGTVAVPSCVGNIGPPRELPGAPPGPPRPGPPVPAVRPAAPAARRGNDRDRHGRQRRPPSRGRHGPASTVPSSSAMDRARPVAAAPPDDATNTTTPSAICWATRPTPGAPCPRRSTASRIPSATTPTSSRRPTSSSRNTRRVAESIAARATANATALGKLHSCATNVTAANEEACARMIATSLAPRALRRTVATTEIDELVTLYKNVRALSTTLTFGVGRSGDDRSAAAGAGVPLSRGARHGRQPATRR